MKEIKTWVIGVAIVLLAVFGWNQAHADAYHLNFMHPQNETPDGALLYPMQIKGTILKCGKVSGVYTNFTYIPGNSNDAVVDVESGQYCTLTTDEWTQDGNAGYTVSNQSKPSPEFYLVTYTSGQCIDCNIIAYTLVQSMSWSENPYLLTACHIDSRSSLSQAQYDAIGAYINANPTLVALAAKANYPAFASITEALNTKTDTVMWKGKMTTSELKAAPFPWKDINGLSIGKYQIWQEMTREFVIDAADVNVRDGILYAFGKGPNGQLLISKMKTKATVAEKIFADGDGTDASPSNAGFRGQLFVNDVIRALKLQALSPTANTIAVASYNTPIDSPPTWGPSTNPFIGYPTPTGSQGTPTATTTTTPTTTTANTAPTTTANTAPTTTANTAPTTVKP